jgi:hypothetical protein
MTKNRKTLKDRRNSGRVTSRSTFDGMGKKVIIENCLEPIEFWDDWKDYRDGLRRKKLKW